MRNQLDQIPYLKEALLAYAADLELQIGREEAQKVLQRVIEDFGWWHHNMGQTRGSEDVERETMYDLKRLKIFWDAYVEYPELSASYLNDNPEKGIKMLYFNVEERSLSNNIRFKPLKNKDLEDTIRRVIEVLQSGSAYDSTKKIRVDLPFRSKSKKPGRPGLSRNEVVKRIARAIWGEELKSSDPKMTWKEIAREIDWPQGAKKSAVKLLEDARLRYKRLVDLDEENILPEAEQKLAELKEKKENN